MHHLGYVQGRYDKVQKRIIPASRYEIVNQRLFTHELFKFVKIVQSEPVYVDINTRFSWIGPAFYNSIDVKFSELYKHSVRFCYKEHSLCHLSYEFFLLHLCIHIYNEAVFFTLQRRYEYDEITLAKLLDIQKLCQSKNFRWEEFNVLCHHYSAHTQVSYVFTVLERLYPFTWGQYSHIIEKHEVSIDTYYSASGAPKTWRLDIKKRMFEIEEKTIEYLEENQQEE